MYFIYLINSIRESQQTLTKQVASQVTQSAVMTSQTGNTLGKEDHKIGIYSKQQSKIDVKGNKLSNLNSDPCIEEKDYFKDCLEQNNKNFTKCRLEYRNSRDCMRFWKFVEYQRLKQSKLPSMPRPEERQAAIDEFMQAWLDKPDWP